MDFHWEERLRRMFTEKLPHSFASVLGETRMSAVIDKYSEDINEYA